MNHTSSKRGFAAILAAAVAAVAFVLVPALPASAASAPAPGLSAPTAVDLNGLDPSSFVVGEISGVCDDGTTALSAAWVKFDFTVVDSLLQPRGYAYGGAVYFTSVAHAWAVSAGTILDLVSMGAAPLVVGDFLELHFTCHTSNWADPPEVISASTYIPVVDTTPAPLPPAPSLTASGTVYYPSGFDPAAGLGTVTAESHSDPSLDASASVGGYDAGSNSATFTVDFSSIAASINVTNRWYSFRFDGPGFPVTYFPDDSPTPGGGGVAMNLGSLSGFAFHPHASSTPPGSDPAPAPELISDPAPESGTPSPGSSLAVDGVWGRQTIIALQRAVGVEPDGVFGPISTGALQARLDAKGFEPGAIDGVWGPLTTAALQRELRTLGYDLGPWGVDGAFGPATIRALQQALNAGRI